MIDLESANGMEKQWVHQSVWGLGGSAAYETEQEVHTKAKCTCIKENQGDKHMCTIPKVKKYFLSEAHTTTNVNILINTNP